MPARLEPGRRTPLSLRGNTPARPPRHDAPAPLGAKASAWCTACWCGTQAGSNRTPPGSLPR
eukprot:8040261-Alexandrium_andersonii.AAC.1